MSRSNGADQRILTALVDGPLTVRQISLLIQMEQHGVLSALRGLVARREVVKLKPAERSKPWRYKRRRPEVTP